MKRSYMKTFKVKLYYRYEGYSGYDHTESKEAIVQARNSNAAINKVTRTLASHQWFVNAFIEQIGEK